MSHSSLNSQTHARRSTISVKMRFLSRCWQGGGCFRSGKSKEKPVKNISETARNFTPSPEESPRGSKRLNVGFRDEDLIPKYEGSGNVTPKSLKWSKENSVVSERGFVYSQKCLHADEYIDIASYQELVTVGGDDHYDENEENPNIEDDEMMEESHIYKSLNAHYSLRTDGRKERDLDDERQIDTVSFDMGVYGEGDNEDDGDDTSGEESDDGDVNVDGDEGDYKPYIPPRYLLSFIRLEEGDIFSEHDEGGVVLPSQSSICSDFLSGLGKQKVGSVVSIMKDQLRVELTSDIISSKTPKNVHWAGSVDVTSERDEDWDHSSLEVHTECFLETDSSGTDSILEFPKGVILTSEYAGRRRSSRYRPAGRDAAGFDSNLHHRLQYAFPSQSQVIPPDEDTLRLIYQYQNIPGDTCATPVPSTMTTSTRRDKSFDNLYSSPPSQDFVGALEKGGKPKYACSPSQPGVPILSNSLPQFDFDDSNEDTISAA